MPTLTRPVEIDAPLTGGWESYPGYAGIDYGWLNADPSRTQRIYAALDGTVASVYGGNGYNQGWGNRIVIDHGYGIQTTYSHIAPGGVFVGTGQRVSTGDHIARMGTTGESTGVHLHFELYVDGARVDPAPFFSAPLPNIPHQEEQEENMFYAIVNGFWHLVVPQGSAKPRVVLLAGEAVSGAALPVIRFETERSVASLKRAVDGL